MLMTKKTTIPVRSHSLFSSFLQREVAVDLFYAFDHDADGQDISLLLINDGQNMEELGLAGILADLQSSHQLSLLLCAAIHCGEDRKNEYGTAKVKDFKGRGGKAGLYTRFVFEELLPFIHRVSAIDRFREKSFAGFSLGGLSALDIAWAHPAEFSRVGVFSGSLWWRTRALDDGYVEETDRIMHDLIRKGAYSPHLKFFFETGTLDETEDRNNNGIIDSIDDTLGLIDELIKKGYDRSKDIMYLELNDGCHDIATWAKAMPVFLRWGWAQ
ncbi:MAG: esterase [Chitinophagaceae bacterium]|nr:esterase [Chitinophagaceae bacterium]